MEGLGGSWKICCYDAHRTRCERVWEDTRRRSERSLRGQPSLQKEERTNIPSTPPGSRNEGQDWQSQLLHRNNLPNLGKRCLTDPFSPFSCTSIFPRKIC